MKKFAFIAAALLAVGTAQAQATSPLYGELGYASLKADADGIDVTGGALRGIIGYEVHPNLAVEGMFALGVKDDSVSVYMPGYDVTINVKGKIQNSIGLFLKPKANLTRDLEVFGRVGFTRTKIKLTASFDGESMSESDSDNDVAYGLGANFQFTKSLYGTVDYTRYYDKDSTKIDGFTLGLGYKF